MLGSLTDKVLGLIFPDRCAGCGRVGALLCPSCCATLRPYPASERLHLHGIDEVRIAFIFEGALRQAIHQLKYQRVRRMAEPLGTLLASHVHAHPLPSDALIPVPLHPHRLRERGFNQSELLAHGVAQACGTLLHTAGLVRSRNTAHQMELDFLARQENVRGAFVWHSPSPPPVRVLLVDDVLTTGATMSACAEALRAAGTREVRALVLARSLS